MYTVSVDITVDEESATEAKIAIETALSKCKFESYEINDIEEVDVEDEDDEEIEDEDAEPEEETKL